MVRNERSSVPVDLAGFYAAEYPRVLSFLRAYCGDLVMAEDVTQEAFTRVCERWEEVSTMVSPSAWVYRVAMNLAKSRFRRRAVRRRKSHLVATDGNREAPDATTAPLVDAALGRLDPDLRAVVALRFCADLSVDVTADLLEIPAGTVKTRTRKAIVELTNGGLSLGMEYADD